MKNSIITSIAVMAMCVQSVSAQVYKDKNATPEERAKSIVAAMTLEEKVSLMTHEAAAVPRLGIKQYNWWNEALHGVGRAGLATVFPQPIGMAATFDDNLVWQAFDAASTEARAKYNVARKAGPLRIYQGLTFWTPNINIFRDPRWGRGHETYGEDPYLTAVMGMNVVRGLQGPQDSAHRKLLACAKHFAVHSGPEWNRHVFDAKDISARDLYETYLPAFQALVQKADVQQVMCAYNRFEGDPCCGSNTLLQQILRNDWGYKGVVVSDCWAVSDFFREGHHYTDPDPKKATARAVRAGTDLECGNAYPNLIAAVKEGILNEEELDVSLVRLMKARYELGEMDGEDDCEWNKLPISVVDSKEHRELALRMSRESMTLLKNDNNTLPLRRDMKIAVIGPNANDSVMQWGNYNGFPSHTSTLLSSLRKRLPAANIIYQSGCDHTSKAALESMFSRCSFDGKPGFKATYWNSISEDFINSAPDAYDQVAQPFHFTTAGATCFAPGVNLGNFTAVYETVFRPERTEEIVFAMQMQGFMRLTINGENVFQGGNMKAKKGYAMKVEAGKEYNMTVAFRATEGDCASLDFDLGREVPLNMDATINAVKDADVIIFAGGISPQLEGEEMPVRIPGFHGGDRDIIELPEVQTGLLERLKSLGKPLIMVNYSGSALALTKESELCDAVLQAWYPGQAGGEAVAETLLGEYNPAGRLPVTFYASTAELPDFEEYSMHNRTYRYYKGQALYPFGHGLSYSTFAYGKAKLSSKKVKKDGELTITVPVKNVSAVDGDEVVQVYLQRIGDEEGPSHALRGFKRVNIGSGKTDKVQLTLTKDELQWFDTNTNTMRVIPGKYALLYGPSSDMNKLQRVEFTIK